MPSAERARLLVPARHPAAAATSVRRYSDALSVPERIVRSALAVGLRVGLGPAALRDRVHVRSSPDAGEPDSLVNHVADIVACPVVVSVGIGTVRANQKPVLQVLSHDGRSLAFVKLAVTAGQRGALATEAAALTALAGRDLDPVEVPELLHLGDWRDLSVLVQTALPTTPLPWRGRFRVPFAAIEALGRHRDLAPVPLGGSRWFQGLADAAVEVDEPVRRGLYRMLVQEFAERFGDHVVGMGAWHGDFSPWNISWHRRRVSVWDWERYDDEVPLGLDVLHYAVALHDQYQPWEVVLEAIHGQAEPLLAQVGVQAEHAEPIVAAYLLELGRRYLLVGQQATGRPLHDRTDALLRHLHGRLGVTARLDLPVWDVA